MYVSKRQIVKFFLLSALKYKKLSLSRGEISLSSYKSESINEKRKLTPLRNRKGIGKALIFIFGAGRG